MIRSAITKLALFYLAIIMALSIGFSFLLYSISSKELKNGLRRPESVLSIEDRQNFEQLRLNRLAEASSSIEADLVLLNIFMLIAAMITSYYLARHTLEPIEAAFSKQISFTSNASHELRTPLTAMKTELEVAMREKSLTKDEMNKLLTSTLEEVTKLENLSNRLLDLSRPQKTNRFENLEIKNIIHEAVNRVKPLADKRKQQIITSGKNYTIINGDKNSFVEVLVILLDNAIKYSSDNSSISIQSSVSKHSIFIKVTDSGSGIKAADLPHIFERFYRADHARNKKYTSGYGLGLSIAKEIIENYNGKLEVSSQPRQGTTFTVKLPLNNA